MTELYKMKLVGDCRAAGIEVIEMGIDSRLEGLTGSHFADDGYALWCQGPLDELQIWIRRLIELAEGDLLGEEAIGLADDIVRECYEVPDE